VALRGAKVDDHMQVGRTSCVQLEIVKAELKGSGPEKHQRDGRDGATREYTGENELVGDKTSVGKKSEKD